VEIIKLHTEILKLRTEITFYTRTITFYTQIKLITMKTTQEKSTETINYDDMSENTPQTNFGFAMYLIICAFLLIIYAAEMFWRIIKFPFTLLRK